jgi:hypothetical protein
MASNAFALNPSKSDTTLLSQKLIHQCGIHFEQTIIMRRNERGLSSRVRIDLK